MAQLPQDLIIEILLRLPVKSLLRFRCLSKSLCSVIDSPNFINAHLSRSSRNFYHRKLIFSEASTKKFHVCDAKVDLEKEIILLENPVTFSWKEIYGYCNGLVLLCHSESKCKLWNPSTRKYSKATRYSFKPEVQIIGTGLGYDESIDDYKATFIVSLERERKRKRELQVQVWIYGLKSITWRRIQNLPYSDVGFLGMGYFSADGSLHWLCTHEIMSFDVRKETFSLVEQPVCSINLVEGVSRKLHVLEGCLCISYFSSFVSGGDQFDLYMRKNDEVDLFTWIKLFSVTEPICFDISWFEIVKVLGYSKGGGKIVLDVGMDYMVSYDLQKKTFSKLGIDMDPRWDNPVLGFVVESLVLVA